MIEHLHGKWVSFEAQGKRYQGKLLTADPKFTTIQRDGGKRVAIPTDSIEGAIEETAPPGAEVP